MGGNSTEKRKLILSNAEQIFIRRGFNGVTMKDIIEESDISRGGLYLYFSSVDEIFIEVIKAHNQANLEQTISNAQNTDFKIMLDNYFETQKKRLLHMENSLLLAMFEFYIAHKNEADKDFFTESFDNINNTVLEILIHGVKEGLLNNDDAPILASNIMYCIKGLETQAMSIGVSENLIDSQFDFYKKLIYTDEEDLSNEK